MKSNIQNKIKAALASLLVGASLVGCSPTPTFDNQIKEICKDVLSAEGGIKYEKVMTSGALADLTSELGYMIGSKNVYVDVSYSPNSLNSLGKNYYDVTVAGLNNGKHCRAELFLFTDDKGKIESVGAWLKTIK